MKRVGIALLLLCLAPGAGAATQLVAKDIRKLGNSQCQTSVTVRYSEPIVNPYLPQRAPMLRSLRRNGSCAGAPAAAREMQRRLETQLLVAMQRRSDEDNSQLRTVVLADDVNVWSQATSESRLYTRLRPGARITVRSITPLWYAIVDPRGFPTGGFVHYSALIGQRGQSQPITTTMAAACNARVRSEPRLDARVTRSTACREPLQVVAAGRVWYQIVGTDGQPSPHYLYGAVLHPQNSRIQ